MPYGLLASQMGYAVEARNRGRYERSLLALVSAKRMKIVEFAERMKAFDNPPPQRSQVEVDEMVRKTIEADKLRTESLRKAREGEQK